MAAAPSMMRPLVITRARSGDPVPMSVPGVRMVARYRPWLRRTMTGAVSPELGCVRETILVCPSCKPSRLICERADPAPPDSANMRFEASRTAAPCTVSDRLAKSTITFGSREKAIAICKGASCVSIVRETLTAAIPISSRNAWLACA